LGIEVAFFCSSVKGIIAVKNNKILKNKRSLSSCQSALEKRVIFLHHYGFEQRHLLPSLKASLPSQCSLFGCQYQRGHPLIGCRMDVHAMFE